MKRRTEVERSRKLLFFLPPVFRLCTSDRGSRVDVLGEKQRRAPFIAFFLRERGGDVVGINPLPNAFGETCKLQFIKEAELFYACAGANIERRYLSVREVLSNYKNEAFFCVLCPPLC